MKKYILILLLGIILIFPAVSYGAPAEVSVEGTNVKVGQESTITITYAGENIGRVSGLLEYDTSVLSYISGGSSTGDAGAVQLKKAGTGGSIVFQLKFKGIKEGSTSIKISTPEVYDLDEQPMEPPGAEEAIQITAEKGTAPVDDPVNNDPLEGNDSHQEENGSDLNTLYLLIGGIILILVIMIIALASRKKRKKQKKPCV